jgi:hypothetical protein
VAARGAVPVTLRAARGRVPRLLVPLVLALTACACAMPAAGGGAAGGGGDCGGATCGETEYCLYGSEDPCGTIDGAGTCQPMPLLELCPGLDAPVCGCDDQTYPDMCAAHAEGVNVARSGPCGPTGT